MTTGRILEKTIQSIASLEGLDKATSIVEQGVLTFAQETYIAAGRPWERHFRTRLRFLDLQRETKFLDRASVVDPISRTHFLPKRMHDVPNPSVLFVTMCKNEEFFIDRWIRHHKCEVKNAQFLVLDDGSSDRTCAIARAHDRVALVSLPTFVQFDDEHRGKSISMLVGAFNAFFDYTIYLDADEFLVCDRDVYYGLDDFLRRNRLASRSAVGVEVVQHRQSEAALGRRINSSYAGLMGFSQVTTTSPPYKADWLFFSPGFHFSETDAILAEAVYILHMALCIRRNLKGRYQVLPLVCKSPRQVENRRGEHWVTKSGLFDALDAAIEQQNISDWVNGKETLHEADREKLEVIGFFRARLRLGSQTSASFPTASAEAYMSDRAAVEAAMLHNVRIKIEDIKFRVDDPYSRDWFFADAIPAGYYMNRACPAILRKGCSLMILYRYWCSRRLLCSPGREVLQESFAFEMQRCLMPLIERNININGFTNVHAINAAVGDKRGLAGYSRAQFSALLGVYPGIDPNDHAPTHDP